MSAWKSRDRLRALSIVTAAPPVAQLDRAPGFEPGCREFESLRAGQSFNLVQGLKVLMGLLNQRLPMVSTESLFNSLGSGHV